LMLKIKHIRGLEVAVILAACGAAFAAEPVTVDDFGDALDAAKVPAAIESLTGDEAMLGHVQNMAQSGAPASVALAKACAAVLARHEVKDAAALAGSTLPADPAVPISAEERIRLAALIDHLVDVCDQDDDITQNVPRELMEVIAMQCPMALGRASAAVYLADQAAPPASAEAVPDLVPLSKASHALDAAADALFDAPGGHLAIDALHVLKSPEEFFDHYVMIKAKLLPNPTKEGIETIIDGIARRVRTAREADKSPAAQESLEAFAQQLKEIRADAGLKAALMVEERQLRDATRVMLDAANREDGKALQALLDAALAAGEHPRDQISGVRGAARVWVEYAVMEDPEDPAATERTLQVFVGVTDDAGKNSSIKQPAKFQKRDGKWVLVSGLGLGK
jgi:hypothetical protein